MNKPVVRIAVSLAVLVGFDLWLSRRHATRAGGGSSSDATAPARPAGWRPGAPKSAAGDGRRGVANGAPTVDRETRVKDILRDYEEIQAKVSAEFSAAGPSFPGGLTAFLRQLSLLEREKRADLAEVMTARELEDYEIRETAAGQRMRMLLDGTAASDGQRRAAFRIEREFNDSYGFYFDVAPAALQIREVARQAKLERVRAVLGVALFGIWLQRDDPGYASLVAFVREQNLADGAALALWQAKNDYLVRKLEIEARPDDTIAARRSAALQEARAKVIMIVGPAAMESANSEVVGWLKPAPVMGPAGK